MNDVERLINAEYNRIKEAGDDKSLASGACGIGLAMILYGRINRSDEYIDKGVKLIAGQCYSLTTGEYLDIHNGHMGIAMATVYMIHTAVATGKLSTILAQVDDNLFRVLALRIDNIESKHVTSLLDIALYLALRLRLNTYEGYDRRIYSKLLSQIINALYPRFYSEMTKETFPATYNYNLPKFLFLLGLSNCRELDNRVNRIITEIKHYVLSQFPYLSANRLFLANSIWFLGQNHTLGREWYRHYDRLVSSVSISDFDEEYRANQCSLFNGTGWLWTQIFIMRKLTGNNAFPDIEEAIYRKVTDYMEHLDYLQPSILKKRGLYSVLAPALITEYIRKNG